MSRTITIVLLALAAALEAGGDAIVRQALHARTLPARMGLFVLGASVLLSYACAVNAPPWKFGELLGVYIVFFFVFAQAMSWLVFRQPPSPSLIAGGVLILAGGVVIALGRAG